ncbi:ANTAR domain-containing protein [Actinomadura sp. 21ATH]|uniref:ANTAR domain-containing protein n=1 Tax=Actinomadura sp. 21ATH TaxID=1735444 RepID=UPI0035C01407
MIGGEARVWGLIAACARRRAAAVSAQDACIACARALALSGVGVSLVAGDRLEPVQVAGRLGRELLEAELTSGDGPCVEAVATGGPVLVADLAEPVCGRRWPVFTATARAARVRAAFAFPLGSGAARVGVLVLCRDRPGPLGPAQRTDALIFADAVWTLLLNDQAGAAGQPLPAGALALGPQIHQAAGMVSVQLDCAIDQALVRLRAHAFAHDVALTEVARQVVERRIRFTPDPTPQD